MSDARKKGQILTPKLAKRKHKEQYFANVCDKHLAWVQTTENVMGLINKQLKAENEEAKAQNKGEYKEVLDKIDELQISNRKFKQENSELVKENYLMEEEKEELFYVL